MKNSSISRTCLIVTMFLLQGLIICVPELFASQILDSRTIKDQKGRIVEINKPFDRIISLYGAHTENLFYLGLNQNIVGVSVHDQYPPEVKNKRKFSYHEGLEKFLAARPDLILIRPMIDRGYSGLVARLERSGITVVSLQPNTIAEMKTYWEILGMLTCSPKRAEKMISTFEQGISYIDSLRNRIKNKKKVYFEAIHSKMKTFANHAIAVYALRKSGGIHIAKDAEQIHGYNIARYGKEKILAKAGQIDVFLSQKGPMNQPTKEKIKNEPGFEIIKAVRENQIYIIEEKLVSRPTLRLLLGINKIGGYLYPKIFDKEVEKHLYKQLGKFGIQKTQD